MGKGGEERFIVQTHKGRSHLLPQCIGFTCPGSGSRRAVRRDMGFAPCWIQLALK